MHLWIWGLLEPNLIWLLPGRDVTCGICDFLGTLARVSIGYLHVISEDEATSSSVRSWTTAGNFNLDVLYFLSLRLTGSAATPQPCCVKLSSFICFGETHFIVCCTIMEIVPINQPGSSSSLSLPSSGSSLVWSMSFPFSQSSELARSLKLPLMAFNISSNDVSGFAVVNPTVSAFLISSCSCLISGSIGSNQQEWLRGRVGTGT